MQLVKRSAKHAAEVLPHKDSDFFKPRVEDFLSKQMCVSPLLPAPAALYQDLTSIESTFRCLGGIFIGELKFQMASHDHAVLGYGLYSFPYTSQNAVNFVSCELTKASSVSAFLLIALSSVCRAAGLLGVKKGKVRLNGLVTSLPTDLQNDPSKPTPTDEPKATLESPRKPPKQKSRLVAEKDGQSSLAAAAAAPGSSKKRKREETSLANAGIGFQASAAGKASKKQKKQAESQLKFPDGLIARDTEDPALDAPAHLQSAPQNAEGNDPKAAPTRKKAKAKSKKAQAAKLGPDTSKEPEAAPPTAKKPTSRRKKPATKKATGTAEDDEQAVDLEEKETVGFNWRDSRKRSDLKHGK